MDSAPRIDLHRHLEGSHSPRALCEVAARHGIQDPLFFDAAAGRHRTPEELAHALVMAAPSDDATVFYECIKKARAAYVNLAAIEDLARLAFLEAATEADCFEMRVSLFSMTRTLLENQRIVWRDVPPTEFAGTHARAVLLALFRARDAAQAQTGQRMLMRLGFSRTFESEPHYRALADMAAEHAKGFVGLDILGIVGGADKEPLPAPLVSIVQGLRRHLPDLTIHAGELEGHASVDRTLELDPQGIGHGVRSVESDATLARLSRLGVTLEVCPSSNRLLIPTPLARITQERAAHPLVVLQRAHVHCVLGSDDPVPFGTSFQREHEVARGLGVDEARLASDTLRRWKQLEERAAK
jgi:adenosine deaminase